MKKIRVNTLDKYKNVSDIYWITESGEVLSEYKQMKPINKRITKPTKKSNNRYYEVCLLHKGSRTKKTYVKLHRLVALAFIKNPSGLPQVNHIDEDSLNNHVDNLEWVTAKENSRYSNGKKVYCYDINGLVKTYEALTDVTLDGFNRGHVASVCRQDIPKGRRHPVIRHKGFTFSYTQLNKEEVVQRLSKKRNFKPVDWRKRS